MASTVRPGVVTCHCEGICCAKSEGSPRVLHFCCRRRCGADFSLEKKIKFRGGQLVECSQVWNFGKIPPAGALKEGGVCVNIVLLLGPRRGAGACALQFIFCFYLREALSPSRNSLPPFALFPTSRPSQLVVSLGRKKACAGSN